ncbi:MAG: DNA translocase FtsK [Candidatus Omnitrophica bacterium]|nr:DNA translocase FtsK [Candidatus Omnitrophota bacterium]
MKQEHFNEIKGILLFAFALICFASLISYVSDDLIWFTSHPNNPAKNLIRVAGAYSAGTLFVVFGYSAYMLVVFLLFWSWNIFTSRPMYFSVARNSCFLVLLATLSALFSLMGSSLTADRFQRGGMVGLVFADFLAKNCGLLGAFIVLLTIAASCLVVTAEFLVSPLLIRGMNALIALWAGLRENGLGLFSREAKTGAETDKAAAGDKLKKKEIKNINEIAAAAVVKKVVEPKAKDDKPAKVEPVKAEAPKAPTIRIIQQKEEPPKDREDKPLVIGSYQFPPFDLLKDPVKLSEGNVQEVLVSGAKMLEQTLGSFGVTVRVVDIERGPVITRYELEPAPGVRVQSINSLADDIALAMQASSVRIQAPIPGKNRVGIEVPNGASAAVVLKDVLMEGNIRNAKSKIMLALGKDTAGKPIVADLAEMPHLLVAGATGAGKSVCLNVIIMSILYNAAPNEVKFIMIDPKMVELNQYNDLPHMLCPAITDHKKVAAALGWVVTEMESRYKTLMKHQVRNIKAYHAKGFEMPYIVVVVDEFADLMQTSGKLVEGAVTRLAQLARAVGIHLILATQRPSVNVITGTIKANLPARISFKVSSQIDARTILDEKGAEDLLGKGDMLFVRPGDPKPMRGQCSFVSDEEIHSVMDFIRKQQKPVYDNSVTAKPVAAMGDTESGDKDEIYEDAVRVIMQTRQASVSILQRRLSLGYGRAGRLLDAMERGGIVGPYCGSKAREILVDPDAWLIEHNGDSAAAATQKTEETKVD